MASGLIHRMGRTNSTAEIVLDVDGMHCSSCVARVEQALSHVDGVLEARVNLLTNQAAVAVQSDRLIVESLVDAVAQAGYAAKLRSPDTGPAVIVADSDVRVWRKRFVLSLIGTLFIVVSGTFGHQHSHHSVLAWLHVVVAGLIQVLVGWPYYVSAAQRLRFVSTNMDTLVALGTTAAFISGSWQALHGESAMTLHDAGMILTFVSLGKWLESLARGNASLAIQRLIGLSPKDTTVVRHGQTIRIPVTDVKVGETIVVLPGERVPLDAEIVSGTGSVNQAWLTGESMPVSRSLGELILAGSINGETSLHALVIKDASATGLAQVIDLVRRAQESRANIQRLADTVVAWFVPFVLTLASIALVVWYFFAGLATAAQFAVAVLVVACPCALGLATPMAILVASGRGAELGILIKNAQAVETAERIDTVILDKTGTVTEGVPAVSHVSVQPPFSPETLLRAAASLESQSNHPLAKAIVQHANQLRVNWSVAEKVTEVAGRGIVGRYPGEATGDEWNVVIGGLSFVSEQGATVSSVVSAEATTLRGSGRIPVIVCLNGEAAGLIAVSDQIRKTSQSGIQSLLALGLRPVLLTGDSESNAQAVAHAVGICELRAQVTPQDKQNVVTDYQRRGHQVAMIGDGINDAAALAAADLGIAIGAGADVAIEAADIVLMRSDLRDAAAAIELARRTLQKLRQNLFWAFLYNVALLPVAAGALVPLFGLALPPSWAAAAMAISSVSVVTNSLLLRRVKQNS